ncbi:MAG: glycosyltransferase family 39 protein [Candidatus Omnitrophota bacterium]
MKKNNIILILLVVFAASLFIRSESFKKKHSLSYDESVYPRIAVQIIKNPAEYNTVNLYNSELKNGRKLPAYFAKPLFKHPPLFIYLVKISLQLFGLSYIPAFWVSLVFGALLILLAYDWGRVLFGENIGLYAAILMAIEPNAWITSQKIWMETTLAFFSVLSLCLFTRAVKKYNPYVMIAGGVAAGLAALTKYPGIIPAGCIFIYAACFERSLFKRKAFIFSLLVPFIMMVPWAVWNYKVYGAGIFSSLQSDGNVKRFFGNVIRFNLIYYAVGIAAVLFAASRSGLLSRVKLFLSSRGRALYAFLAAFLIAGFSVLFAGYIRNALDIRYIPPTGWITGMFNAEPWGFYTWKIMELSPLYIFSYLAFFTAAFDAKKYKEYLLVFIPSAVLMIFWVAWGAYQSRYIVALSVPMMILASRSQFLLFEWIRKIENKNLNLAARGLLFAVIAYFIFKTLLVDINLALPNTACYY